MSLHHSTELLARLEKHALDQARLTLQALELELARQQEALAVAERRLAGEHASAWRLPGGPRGLGAYLNAEAARQQAMHGAAGDLARTFAHAQAALQKRLRRYKALDLAAQQISASDSRHELHGAQAEVEEAGILRAASR